MRVIHQLHLSIVSLLLTSFLFSSAVDADVNWLTSNQQLDGSIHLTTDIASSIQSTAETLNTLQLLSPQTDISEAISYINTSQSSNTEFLVRKIIINNSIGSDVTTKLNELFSRANEDGAFGEDKGYSSTLIDTAYALLAFAETENRASDTTSFAVGHLLSKQASTGAFAEGVNGPSLFLTAFVSHVLQQYKGIYNVDGAIESANAFLISQVNADGSIGTVLETAMSLLSLSTSIFDKTQIQPVIDYLNTNRLSNLSWNNDVYITAIVLRALDISNKADVADPVLASLNGFITDIETGNSIENAKILVTGSSTIEALTDSEGRYSLVNLQAGTISITVSHNNYLSESVSSTVVSGQKLTFSPALTKNPQPIPLSIIGHVVDATTSTPVTGVSVFVQGTSVTAQTNLSGSFIVNGLAAGTYQVNLSKAGYQTASFTLAAPSGGPFDFGTIQLAPVEVIDPNDPNPAPTPTTGKIVGTMTDASSSVPLQGVLVSLAGVNNKSTFTDANGQFVIENITPSNVSLTASLTGYFSSTGTGSIVAGGTLNFTSAMVKETKLAAVTIKGQVLDAASNTALSTVNINVSPSGLSTQTNAQGEFLLSGLDAGTYEITISQTGYVSVSTTVTAANGNTLDFGTVLLVTNTPVTTNRAPEISTQPNTSVVAGTTYTYLPTAIDPDGDPITWHLLNAPSNMTVNVSTGEVRWLATSSQTGNTTFSLIAADDKSAKTEQIITLAIIQTNGRSFVSTDVQTLSGLTINSVIPANYVIGTYVSGGDHVSTGTSCSYTTTNTGTDLTQAASSADYNAVQIGNENDLVVDLGNSFQTVSIFPQIDQATLPQEGIEYTVWGSNDPNAVFPDDWQLATLVSLYQKGWVDVGCATQSDDYAGLHTFSDKQFQYIRVKSDYSISIFNTPQHTDWESVADGNTDLPGWQSSNAEIDAVAGMLCGTLPIANAGNDIIGLINDSVTFDASSSQGNIIKYGWDIDGDNTIDITGQKPSWKFNAGFDANVRLLVVDAKGCVGTDTVHVSIDFDLPKPDLNVTNFNTSGLSTNIATLNVNGDVTVSIINKGKAALLNPAQVSVFEDINNNEQFDSAIDNILSTLSMPRGLDINEELTMTLPINGKVSFRDKTLYAYVDSDFSIAESNEDNNIDSTIGLCQIKPLPSGQLDPVVKWHWSGTGRVNSQYRQVMSSPVVAQLNDDNGDGKVDINDIPDVIFTTFRSRFYRENSILRAVSGKDGSTIWDASEFVGGISAPAVGDIDGDGLVEIIVAGPNLSGLLAFENDGTLKWRASGSGYGHAALADLDNNGTVEIVYQGNIYDANGNIQATISRDSNPLLFDADLDGDLEILSASKLYDHTGQELWKGVGTGSWGAIGNFDDDPFPEIVLGNGSVTVLEHTGEIKWGPVAIPGGGGGPVTIADMDGDGKPEIGVAGANFYVVFETNGAIKWQSPTRDHSSRSTGSTVFDFEGDGRAEILYSDELNFRIYDGTTGNILVQIPNPSGTVREYPIVVDLDNDKHAEIVLVANNYAFSGVTGVRVLENRNDDWMPTRSIWNQHSYHINNVNDDGTIPQFEKASWLSHNSYRLNTFADRNPLDQVDLTASLLKYVDEGNSVKLSVRIGNAGAGASPDNTKLVFTQNDGTSVTVIAETLVATLQPGEYRDVEITNLPPLSLSAKIVATIDSDNQITECNETNNIVQLPVKVQTGAGAITASTDKAVYAPESDVSLMASVSNASSLPGEYRTKLQVMDMQNNIVAVFGPESVGIINGQASINITKPWSTGTFIAGQYVLHATLYNNVGQVLSEATNKFEIRHPDTSGTILSLRLNTDQPVYHTTDTTQIESLVQNLSVSTVVPDAVLELSITSPASQIVHNISSTLGQLVSGSSIKGNDVYEYQNTSNGLYHVQGQLKDAQGLVFATATTQYEVVENPLKALKGDVSVQFKHLYVGEQSQLCTSTATNTGTQDFTALKVKQVLIKVGTQEVISTKENTVDLLMGNNQTLVNSIDTTTLEPDFYNCLLVATVSGKDETLAFDAFTLDIPPIVIDSQLTLGNRGRVLVLLDSEKEHESHKDDDQHENNEHDSDEPHGPKLAPSLTEQRAFLESQLNAQGWSYTIVTDDDEFERELHTGGFNAYALFSEHEKLDEDTQKELREAVFRGDGLIVAGSHDERNHYINDALGIKVKGKHAGITDVKLLASPFSLDSTQSLAYTDKVLRAELVTAQVAATFSSSESEEHDNDHDKDEGNSSDKNKSDDEDDNHHENINNAITYNQYGLGKAIFVGFDLLAHATSIGESGLFDEVINQSLAYSHPPMLSSYSGRVVSVNLSLTNQGMATAGQVVMSLPIGSQVMDMKSSVGAASVNTAASSNTSVITWPYTLIEEQVINLQVWLKLPNVIGNVTIPVLIQTGEAPDWKDYEATTLTVQTQAYPVLSDINNDLLLLGDNKYLKKARRYLDDAIAELAKSDFEEAHEKLLDATDELIKVIGVSGIEVPRQKIDWVIADIARFIVHEEDND